MASQVLNHPHIHSGRAIVIPIDRYRKPATVPPNPFNASIYHVIPKPPVKKTGMGWASRVLMMLSIEAVTILCLFAVWHVWSLLR